MKLIAKTFSGLEQVCADEIKNIGGENIDIQKRAVVFEGDQLCLYKANYELRTALRILKPFHQFQARNDGHLYKHVNKIDWTEIISNRQTFAIDSTVHSPYFTHSKYASLKVKDAIVDQIRDKTGARPSVDIKKPDVRIHLRINQDEVTLLQDSSGFSLHRRNYRNPKHLAPINEALAAGMILLSGWNSKTPYVDLMCGSGTFLIEAAMIASNTAPGIVRDQFYTFEQWPDFDQRAFQKVKREAKKKVRSIHSIIQGSDVDGTILEIAKEHIQKAGFENEIFLKQVSVSDSKPLQQLKEGDKGTILLNPPYGKRLLPKDIEKLYKQIGDSFKQNYKFYQAWVISSNKDAMKKIGLRTSKRLTLFNGPLECKFHRFDLY